MAVQGTMISANRLVEWSDDLSVGLRSIDDEHRRLVAVVNRIVMALGTENEWEEVNAAVTELFSYAEYHFGHEQDLMATYRYPDANAHQSDHERFVRDMRAYESAFGRGEVTAAELVRYVKRWLIGHVLVVDRRLGQYLQPRLSRRLSPGEFPDQEVPAA